MFIFGLVLKQKLTNTYKTNRPVVYAQNKLKQIVKSQELAFDPEIDTNIQTRIEIIGLPAAKPPLTLRYVYIYICLFFCLVFCFVLV